VPLQSSFTFPSTFAHSDLTPFANRLFNKLKVLKNLT
jgi:hypothetical protein